MSASFDTHPVAARKLIEIARFVLLITWAVYPIAYALCGTVSALEAKACGSVDASGIVYLQVGYAIADMTAKAGFGMLIYFIARAKSVGVENSAVGQSTASPAVAYDDSFLMRSTRPCQWAFSQADWASDFRSE